jgi:hypothetical protein
VSLARSEAGYALFRAGVKVSAGTCDDLAGSLRRRHERNGPRWRLLDPVAQAVLVIAFLRTNLTCAELAAGSGISPATCWRDIAEGISVLADRGRRISLKDVARLAVRMGWDYLIVDGTHVPVVTSGRKTGGQRAFYSGKHKRHGLNVQTVCSPHRDLLRAAAPRPGAVVDVTAARQAGIAGDILRCIGERGNAQLKHWKALATELRCRPERCTAVVKADTGGRREKGGRDGARAGSVQESVTSREEVRPMIAVSLGCSPSSSRLGD